jgi:phenylacetyl-CoA:acceptor oxidoreductase subunit 2
MPGASLGLLVAGLLAVGGGWVLKFTLIRRAAFSQGMAVPHLPVRGRGAAGSPVKPGWTGPG